LIDLFTAFLFTKKSTVLSQEGENIKQRVLNFRIDENQSHLSLFCKNLSEQADNPQKDSIKWYKEISKTCNLKLKNINRPNIIYNYKNDPIESYRKNRRINEDLVDLYPEYQDDEYYDEDIIYDPDNSYRNFQSLLDKVTDRYQDENNKINDLPGNLCQTEDLTYGDGFGVWKISKSLNF